MTAPNLTLYGIETQLLELFAYRDEVAGEVRVTEADLAEQREALKAIDHSIAEYIRLEVAKVDNVAAFIRECRARAAALKSEEQRLASMRRALEEREEFVKSRIAEAMALDVNPLTIANAKQNNVLKRFHGRIAQLKLCKSPESVDITDESLVPSEYKNVTVTMPASVWADIKMQVPGFRGVEQISKSEIAKALKADEPVPGARLITDALHVKLG
jgi:Siphovirus Gp157